MTYTNRPTDKKRRLFKKEPKQYQEIRLKHKKRDYEKED